MQSMDMQLPVLLHAAFHIQHPIPYYMQVVCTCQVVDASWEHRRVEGPYWVIVVCSGSIISRQGHHLDMPEQDDYRHR